MGAARLTAAEPATKDDAETSRSALSHSARGEQREKRHHDVRHAAKSAHTSAVAAAAARAEHAADNLIEQSHPGLLGLRARTINCARKTGNEKTTGLLRAPRLRARLAPKLLEARVAAAAPAVVLVLDWVLHVVVLVVVLG